MHMVSIKYSYLSNRWHRTKTSKQFSYWKVLIHGVPQASILSPFLFNICQNDLFYLAESTIACNFADHTTFNACQKYSSYLINKLEHNS